MRKFLIILIMCLSSSISYAANPKYLLGIGGVGSGIALVSSEMGDFAYTKNQFFGVGFQRVFYGKTLFDVAGLYYSKTDQVSPPHLSGGEFTSTWATELTLKYPFIRINITEGVQPRIYVRGGMEGSFAKLCYASNNTPLYTLGPLVGLGCQVELSRLLVDVSINKVFSLIGESNHPWYGRVGVGFRL